MALKRWYQKNGDTKKINKCSDLKHGKNPNIYKEPSQPLNIVLFSSEFRIEGVIKRLIYNDDPIHWRQNCWLTLRQNDV